MLVESCISGVLVARLPCVHYALCAHAPSPSSALLFEPSFLCHLCCALALHASSFVDVFLHLSSIYLFPRLFSTNFFQFSFPYYPPSNVSLTWVPLSHLDTRVWTQIRPDVSHRRLSHAVTQVGSYLFITGGHDGNEYTSELLMFNLGAFFFLCSNSPSGSRGFSASATSFFMSLFLSLCVFSFLFVHSLSAN